MTTNTMMSSTDNDDIANEKLQNMDKASTLTSDSTSPRAHPVDKGWAWIIMIGSFSVHFLTVGYIRSFGILFVEFQSKYGSSSAMTSVISGVQSLSYSVSTLIVMNLAVKYLSARQLAMMGAFTQFLGVSLSSLVSDVPYLVLTQGVLFGLGQAMIYCPTMVILSQYFEKRRPIATVISTCGVSAGGVAFPLLTRYLVDTFGLRGGLILLATAVLQQAVFGSFFTPPSHYYFPSEKKDNLLQCLNDKESKEHPLNISIVIDKENSKDEHSETVAIKDSTSLKDNKNNSFSHDNNNHIPHSLPRENFSLSDTLKEDLTHLLECRRASQEYFLYDVQRSANSIVDGSFTKHPFSTRIPSSQYDQNDCSGYAPHEDLDPDPELKHLLEKVGCGSAPDQSMLSSDTVKNSVMRFRSNSESESKRSIMTEQQSLPKFSRTKNPHSSKQSLHRKDHLTDSTLQALSISSIDLYSSLHSVSQQNVSSLHSHPRNFNRAGKGSSQWEVKVEEQIPEEPLRRKWCRLPKMANTISFWLVAVFFASGGIGSGLPNVFIPPLCNEKGLDKDAPALFLMVSAVTDMIGRLLSGLILHFGYMRPTTVVMAPMFACATIFQFTSFFNDFGSLLALAITSGLFTSAFWAMQSLVVIEVLGLENLGSALGFYSILVGLFGGISYPIGGALKDISGTYAVTFCYFGATYFLAVACMVLVQFTKKEKEKNLDDSEEDDDN